MISTVTPELILYTTAIGLIVIGLAGVVISSHLFRMVLALVIAEAGANLMLVLAGYRWDAVAPILTSLAQTDSMVDPVPQALVLTAIVIGVGIQALAVSLLIRIHQRYATLDRKQAVERMDAEIAASFGAARDVSQEAPLGERPIPPVPADEVDLRGDAS
ncbi:MAG: Na+/H+ antiporter subunit C [gamma proteobacterium symbiont of Ctena orbiculata]|nr:MAG: Na+/H+ antiporter subunit C [gamma proteobacterium symbiont of Ctena orbiculata]PVV18468.1 MAG: Na+/H+ antiporter subunit C [gamma proteobacterium symbiont of Ctena orbiculata]PVV25573.1 MAG: Na+/H+ antiporter subunit C [gamma proteobacterium symbiont of Ctena orbiculata]